MSFSAVFSPIKDTKIVLLLLHLQLFVKTQVESQVFWPWQRLVLKLGLSSLQERIIVSSLGGSSVI